jgi:hypothetical protein
MIRTILSVIAAYFVMAFTMFLTFTLLYLVLGAEGSFKPGSYDISTAWMIGSVVLGFLAVLIGGYVAVLLSKEPKAALWFGAIVLVVSLLVGYAAYQKGNPHEIRAGNVGNTEAMTKAQNPTWLNFLVPFTGFLAAIIGGRLRKVERRY